MNRHLLLGGVALCWMVLPLRAQDALADAARREESEQRYRELQTRLTQLEEALQTYQKRMSDELRSLRDQMDRLSSGKSGAGPDELRRLQKAIEEVDRNRLEDNAKIVAQLSRLRDDLGGKTPAATRPKASAPPLAKGGTEKGYEYTIRKGDRLGLILQGLREQGINLTQKQMEEANPDVDWKKLQIGQKIFIPAKPE